MINDSNKLWLVGQQEIADYLGIHKTSVSRMCSKGKLPAVYFCGQYRIRIGDLEDWLSGKGGRQ